MKYFNNLQEVMEVLIRGKKVSHINWGDNCFICLRDGHIVDETGFVIDTTNDAFRKPYQAYVFDEYTLDWKNVIRGFAHEDFCLVKSSAGVILDSDFTLSEDMKVSALRRMKWKVVNVSTRSEIPSDRL